MYIQKTRQIHVENNSQPRITGTIRKVFAYLKRTLLNSRPHSIAISPHHHLPSKPQVTQPLNLTSVLILGAQPEHHNLLCRGDPNEQGQLILKVSLKLNNIVKASSDSTP